MSKIKNSSDEIYNHLLLEYRKKLMKIEMEIFKARQTRMLNKTQRYFNSTPLRNAFARWMVNAFYENTFYTITYLVKEMCTNRQTISQMINECEKEGYINVVRTGKTVSCQASDTLIEKVNDYCDWRKKITELTVGKAYTNLISFERWMF
jgi:hypothetical protein